MITIFDLATCVGCGCDDDHACACGCYWARVDRASARGVCSCCPQLVPAWDRGEYTANDDAAPPRCAASSADEHVDAGVPALQT